MKSGLKLVFMGTPAFSLPSLKKLVEEGYEPAAVYTQPDRPAGRGRALGHSPVKQFAREKGLPLVQPESLKDPDALEALTALQPDVIIVSAYGLLLPQKVLDIPKHGCLNIHPSLLPRHRGASPVAGAILAGDEYTGVSIMLLDAGMDTGPVLKQVRIPVSGNDTTSLLTEKLSLVAAPLLLEVLPRWAAGEIAPRPQDDAAATYTNPLNKSEGEMDWDLPAAELWRRVRAFNPWPGCYTVWQGKQLKILTAEILPADEAVGPGQVKPLGRANAGFGVGTGDGVLGVTGVQLEGKKAVSAADFLRGQLGFAGAKLPS